jgi:hypothetical protein
MSGCPRLPFRFPDVTDDRSTPSLQLIAAQRTVTRGLPCECDPSVKLGGGLAKGIFSFGWQ